ncbi:MAG: OmpA family protein [Alphaproteobacteria bacterium]|nr:OmpA family protein [Alphaproteobacteria bacterium]
MLSSARTRIGALVVSGVVLAGSPVFAEEPVIVGGTGKPSVSVDMGVLDSLGASPFMPQLMMPGPGPARNGRIELHAPGTAPAAATQAPPEPVEMTPPEPAMAEPKMAEPEEKIVLTPPAPKAAPVEPAEEEMAEPAPAPAPVPAPVEKKMTEPAPAEAVAKPPPAMPEKVQLTPPPAKLAAPKPAAPAKPAAPLEMPDAPPPPVTLTEPIPTPTPPPEPPAAAKETPPPVQKPAVKAVEETARLPETALPVATDEPLSVEFASESALLSDKAKAALDAFAERLKNAPSSRVQLLAYASGTQETASQARRLSLSRALVVRSYLIEAGVSSIRIDVRALGNKVEGEPADRVDLTFPKS